jgi:hypothetical protein
MKSSVSAEGTETGCKGASLYPPEAESPGKSREAAFII